MIGFYDIEHNKSKTLFINNKNVLSQMDMSLTACKRQRYGGAPNLVGAKTGTTTSINEIEPHALLMHCHGHALELPVGDTIKIITLMGFTQHLN